MRIRYWLLLLLLITVTGAWLGAMMTIDPGYVMFAWRHTTVEMSLWMWLVITLTSFLGAYFLVRLMLSAKAPWHWLNQWSHDSKLKRMQVQTRHGLLALANGQYKRAQEKLSRLAKETTQPLVVIPALAQAEGRLGLYDRALKRLKKLGENMPEAKILVAMTAAELYQQQGNHEYALQELKKVSALDKNHCLANEMQLELLQGMQYWPEVIDLLQVIKSAKQMPDDILAQQQCNAYRHACKKLAQRENGLEQIMTMWRKAPEAVIKADECRLTAAQTMAKAEGKPTKQTAEFIERSLNQRWNDDLVLEYSHLAFQDAQAAQAALKKAEAWLNRAEHSAALQLALGRLCRRLELWGKTSDYLNASVQLQPSKEAYGELARLQQQLGNTQESLEYYRLASVH